LNQQFVALLTGVAVIRDFLLQQAAEERATGRIATLTQRSAA
jgi:hypothetical protein